MVHHFTYLLWSGFTSIDQIMIYHTGESGRHVATIAFTLHFESTHTDIKSVLTPQYTASVKQPVIEPAITTNVTI